MASIFPREPGLVHRTDKMTAEVTFRYKTANMAGFRSIQNARDKFNDSYIPEGA